MGQTQDMPVPPPEKKPIKKMTVKEFREQGYLRELNRQFLHPLGLALEVVAPSEGEDFEERFGEVWDYRDEPEGMAFEDSMVSTDKAREQAERIEAERTAKHGERTKLFGWIIQPIGGEQPFEKEMSVEGADFLRKR